MRYFVNFLKVVVLLLIFSLNDFAPRIRIKLRTCKIQNLELRLPFSQANGNSRASWEDSLFRSARPTRLTMSSIVKRRHDNSKTLIYNTFVTDRSASIS